MNKLRRYDPGELTPDELNIYESLGRAREQMDAIRKLLDEQNFKIVLRMFFSWITGPVANTEPPKYKTVLEVFENLERLKNNDPETFNQTINLIISKYGY